MADKAEETPTERLRRALGYSSLGTRVYNTLMREGITTLEELNRCTYADLLELRLFGKGALACVIDALEWDKQDREHNNPAK